jgi:hypothetical protein
MFLIHSHEAGARIAVPLFCLLGGMELVISASDPSAKNFIFREGIENRLTELGMSDVGSSPVGRDTVEKEGSLAEQ